MINKLPQLVEALRPEGVASEEIVQCINSHINEHSCENLDVDISFMNIIDACYVSTLCATRHFAKYPQGKICWKVSSDKVEEFNKDFELGNCSYIL